jgi:predicted ATPase/DNA-binding CsgD family transcriptional regulator
LLGRERELIEVQLRLLRDDVRLLTLTGAGGSGKTRLAMEAARTLADSFSGGVLFVDLSPLSEPAEVIRAIAGLLGIREAGDQSSFERLQQVLAGREHLVLLDNFEHLLAAAPHIVELLATCPELKILATSRAALRVRWEHEFAVWPLALPETAQVPDLEGLARVPSVALFIDRVRSACPDFQFGPDNAAAVAEICQRLDGLPLALELAAARTRLLPPRTLARRLQARLPTLSSGPRDLPARQHTLRASIAWSYELLDAHERRVFRRLAVFMGGGRLDEVEQVCRDPDGPDAGVLDGLAGLVEHNLVRRDTMPDGEPRLRMLETVREFALEELDASGEAEAIRRRHALTWVAVAEAADTELLLAHRTACVARLAADFDNLRTALTWLLDHEEADLSCRLVGALTWWWYQFGRVGTGLAWAEQALACHGTAGSTARAKALFAAGALALMLGDDSLARPRLEQAAALFQALGDKAGVAHTRIHLGIVMAVESPAEARSLHEQALAVIRQIGDASWTALALLSCGNRAFATGDTSEAHAYFVESVELFSRTDDTMMAAQALNKLGDVARCSAEYEPAAALYKESLELMRRHDGDFGIAGVLHNLGYVAQHQAEYGQALTHFCEAIALFRAAGDRRGMAECLLGIGGVALGLGQPERAALLFGAADAALQSAGMTVAASNLADYERNLAAARSRLGTAGFASAWSAGRALVQDEAIAYATATGEQMHDTSATPSRRPVDGRLAPLTPREREVAMLLARSLSNRQIATQLVISEQTAETHAKRVLHKLGVSSRHYLREWLEPAPGTWPSGHPCLHVRELTYPRSRWRSYPPQIPAGGDVKHAPGCQPSDQLDKEEGE